jgi:hypothetical protein
MAKKEDKKFIEEQIPVQDRPNTAFQSSGVSGGFRGFPKPLKPTKSFLQKQAAKEKLKREVQSAQLSFQLSKFGKKTKTKKVETPSAISRKGSANTKADNDFFPKVKESFFGQQTINEQVKNASINFPNPTGVNLKNKLAVVGDTVVTTTTAGAIVKINPDILPKEDLNKIKVLPDEADELEIQKVLEKNKGISTEQISDLAVKTKIKPDTTPERIKKVSTFKPQEISDLAVKTKPQTEETLIGTQEDVELDEPDLEEVELTDPDKEITPVPVVDPDVIQDPLKDNEPNTIPEPDPIPDPAPDVDPVPDPDLDPVPDPAPDVDPVPDPAPDVDPVPDPAPDVNPVPDPDVNPVPDPDVDPVPDPDPDVDPVPDPAPDVNPVPDPADFGRVTTKPKPIAAITPKIPKSTKQPEKQKKAPFKKKKPSKNKFRTKNGLKPTVTNFKTKKSTFQSNNVTGDIFKAPKGTQFDTNAGFREDSFKAIKFADKKLKFKNRKDVLVAAEKKGLI